MGWGAGSGANTKSRFVVLVVPLLVVAVFPLVFAVRIQRREAALRHGTQAEGEVIGVERRSSSTTFLEVGIGGDCNCTVVVATDNLAAHPVHSTIAVRYDPGHLDRAEALVDSPNPYAPILPLVAGLVLTGLLVGPLLWVASRRRRKSLALVETTAPAMRARIEAWRRFKGNTPTHYLSIYPASSPPGTAPLLVLPTDAKTVARLHEGEVFDLYGDGTPGHPLALRDGDVVVAAAAKTRSGDWEAGNRTPLAEIQLPPASTTPDPAPTSPEPPLFTDVAEARAWRRNSAVIRWLWPVLILLPLIRVLPAPLIVWALPVIGLAMVGESWALWRQQRLLDGVAARLSGPPITTRMARRAARSAASARLASPAGVAELAALLDVPPERLVAQQRAGARLVVGAFGVLAVGLVVVLIFPSAAGRVLSRWTSRHEPAIAGGPGYRTFTGPLGRPLPVGRPWGRVCQPVRFTVEEHVPNDIYANVVTVVTAARSAGIDVTVEDRSFMWTPASLYYPPGTTTADVVRVPIFADSAVHPHLANGQPERVTLSYDAKPDPDGRHEDLTSAQGELRLRYLNGDQRRERTAIRQIIGLTQGVAHGAGPGSGLNTGTSEDGFSAADVAALRLMSGCP